MVGMVGHVKKKMKLVHACFLWAGVDPTCCKHCWMGRGLARLGRPDCSKLTVLHPISVQTPGVEGRQHHFIILSQGCSSCGQTSSAAKNLGLTHAWGLVWQMGQAGTAYGHVAIAWSRPEALCRCCVSLSAPSHCNHLPWTCAHAHGSGCHVRQQKLQVRSPCASCQASAVMQ